ncbi:phospholipase effector Tle1 domain-containing protein [Paracoccus sp. 22332]|uniref:phospholipase effector Tle1 domain-containing protein n=1 Tax=Paracoccus sp. 22332 TaxID=3453913 RepID=UPI003F85A4AF
MQFDAAGNPLGGVEVHFLGLFDTVEAYGLPIEELRSVWDFWIAPITFRNRQVSQVVRRVRHAMALDEERLTFTPLNCNRAKGPAGVAQDIQEVWFPGCHSDIGGGYPDDRPAFQALEWMASEAKGFGLKLRRGALTDQLGRRTPTAPIHDSRRGLSGYYRYQPRRIRVDPEVSAMPVVHTATSDMVLNGCNGYAPLTLQPGFAQLGAIAPAIAPRQQGAVADLITMRVIVNRLNYALLGTLAVLAIVWLARARFQPGDFLEMLQGNWVVLLGLVAASGSCMVLGWTLRDRICDQARISWLGAPIAPGWLARLSSWLGGKARHGKLIERVRRPWRVFVTLAVPAAIFYLAYRLIRLQWG